MGCGGKAGGSVGESGSLEGRKSSREGNSKEMELETEQAWEGSGGEECGTGRHIGKGRGEKVEENRKEGLILGDLRSPVLPPTPSTIDMIVYCYV